MDSGDRMYCHACGGIWLKDDDVNLACPHCQSEFTEIVHYALPLPPSSLLAAPSR